MAQNARRQMSATNRSGMNKYKRITYNGVTYFLVPQAKGTYALKTSDGKLAGSLPIINASTYTKAVRQAKRLVQEIEAETERSNSVSSSDMGIVTTADYDAATGDIETVDVKKNLPLDKPSIRSKARVAWSRRPRPVSKFGNKLADFTELSGLEKVEDGLAKIREDARGDIFMGNGDAVGDNISELQSFVYRSRMRRERKFDYRKTQALNSIYKRNSDNYNNALATNRAAFTAYKESLVQGETEKLSRVNAKLAELEGSKDAAAIQKLTARKEQLEGVIQATMSKNESAFPKWKPPHGNLLNTATVDKTVDFSDRRKHYKNLRHAEASSLDAARHERKLARLKEKRQPSSVEFG